MTFVDTDPGPDLTRTQSPPSTVSSRSQCTSPSRTSVYEKRSPRERLHPHRAVAGHDAHASSPRGHACSVQHCRARRPGQPAPERGAGSGPVRHGHARSAAPEHREPDRRRSDARAAARTRDVTGPHLPHGELRGARHAHQPPEPPALPLLLRDRREPLVRSAADLVCHDGPRHAYRYELSGRRWLETRSRRPRSRTEDARCSATPRPGWTVTEQRGGAGGLRERRLGRHPPLCRSVADAPARRVDVDDALFLRNQNRAP